MTRLGKRLRVMEPLIRANTADGRLVTHLRRSFGTYLTWDPWQGMAGHGVPCLSLSWPMMRAKPKSLSLNYCRSSTESQRLSCCFLIHWMPGVLLGNSTLKVQENLTGERLGMGVMVTLGHWHCLE